MSIVAEPVMSPITSSADLGRAGGGAGEHREY
jgi:hypothetical protein